MRLEYANKSVEELCTNEKKAQKKLGTDTSKKLAKLMNALENAETLIDIHALPQYRLHSLSGSRENQLSIVIHKESGYRLIVLPYDNNDLLLESSDNEKVRFEMAVKISIREVSDHYEK